MVVRATHVNEYAPFTSRAMQFQLKFYLSNLSEFVYLPRREEPGNTQHDSLSRVIMSRTFAQKESI